MTVPLHAENLTKRYAAADPPAVDGLSFEVRPDEVFALVGPSGCGKTTTLRIIAGFERPEAGSVWLGDQRIEGPGVHLPPERRRIGLVFQELALFPHLSVLKNVMFGLRDTPRGERRRRAMQVLDLVHMTEYAHRKPQQLSGGQQQRVALARSMAPRPRVILLDEPFANLDPGLRESMRNEVRSLLKQQRASALLVTHDQEEALSFADRIGVMDRGRVLQTGDPAEVYNRPASSFVASFLGRTNLIRADAGGEHAATPIGPMCLAAACRGPVTLSVRPEHLRLVPPRPDEPAGVVTHRAFKGHDLTLRVRLGECEYTVQTDYNCPYQVGQHVGVMHAEPAVVVDRETES